jgi:hypothetical protein
VKPAHNANDRLLCHTCEVWEPRLGRRLTREDARQIVENVSGVFALLAEWSRAETLPRANERPYASRNGEAHHDR